jgi:mannan endo-1,4-beta-mannosidase
VRRITTESGMPIIAGLEAPGRHRRSASLLRGVGRQWRGRNRLTRIAVVLAAITAVAAGVLASGLFAGAGRGKPPTPRTYLGIYTAGVPESYAGISAFTAATGVRPGLVVYYSGWGESFRTGFARQAAGAGAVPLVQIDPDGVSLARIASGWYDRYLRSYAAAVKSFGGQVILSFGHEMNGYWYSWGYRHTSPRVFVAAWRHIVTVFRSVGARNVIWLWTVNIIGPGDGIQAPAAWWPGGSYVTMVGIDGYYLKRSWTFASLFGPTIKAVRALTLAPILISETGAPSAAGQPAKIANLFAGIRAYGLLGFVWFDAKAHHELPGSGIRDWQLNGPAAFAAYRRGARAYKRPAA